MAKNASTSNKTFTARFEEGGWKVEKTTSKSVVLVKKMPVAGKYYSTSSKKSPEVSVIQSSPTKPKPKSK